MTPDSPPSSPPSPSKRRTPLVVAVLGAAVLLAGVGLLSRRAGGGEDPSGARQGAASASPRQEPSPKAPAGAGGDAAPAQEAEAAARRFDATTCWRDLERFNEAVTLETFRAWAAPLLASGDPLVQKYLKERLAELIGNDAGRASEVLGWAREAGPQEFGVILSGLRDAEAVHLPQVAAKLADLALDGSIELERRAGLMSALDTQKRFEPAMLGRLADFARDPGSGEAGWAATRTIGRVMKRDFEKGGNATAYLDKLLTIGAESIDENIRYLALTMPMHSAPLLDARATERYAKVLTSEGSPDVRDAAAHNLSLSEDKQKVLALFTQAFASERELCVRWSLFRFAARAAGRDALPVLADMALLDLRFQPTYQDFERVYASGILDFERVWMNLSTQDPHGCLHRDDH